MNPDHIDITAIDSTTGGLFGERVFELMDAPLQHYGSSTHSITQGNIGLALFGLRIVMSNGY